MSLLCQVGRNLLRNSEKVYLNTAKITSIFHSLPQPYRNYVQRHDYQNENKEKFVPFDKLSTLRREEAKRTILVQVNSEESFAELQSYCLQFGDVQGVYHFVVSAGHFMLIEFSKESEASSVLQTSNHIEGTGVPTRSPFLWFRAATSKSKAKKGDALISPTKDIKLVTINGLSVPKDDEIESLLITANDIDDQILLLYKSTCLNDLGIRLRYFTARQVESVLSGLFPNVTVRPFGSSVSGFGKQGCDLDLVLRLDNDEHKDDSSRFVFHTKTYLSNGRTNTQRQMEVVGDLLQLFTPGCANVRRILQARVPIIKYYQEYVGLECDLSMTNLSGVYMSELLYIMGCIDSRICPLMFAIRKWAQNVGITNPSPGRWISNFSLTLLVIYSLQQNGTSGAVLPKIKNLIDNANKEDFRVTEDQINCTFIRDINNQNIWDLNNTESLYSLLLNFFEFYSTFDFNCHAISVVKGIPVSKPDHSPMYIINPLEPQLNVSKNVSYEEMQKFRIEVRNAAWALESFTDSDKNHAKSWGLLNIFRKHQLSIKTPGFLLSNKKPRLMDVTQLFDEGDVQQPIELKNQNLKQEIGSIKKDTQSQIKKFRSPRARRR